MPEVNGSFGFFDFAASGRGRRHLRPPRGPEYAAITGLGRPFSNRPCHLPQRCRGERRGRKTRRGACSFWKEGPWPLPSDPTVPALRIGLKKASASSPRRGVGPRGRAGSVPSQGRALAENCPGRCGTKHREDEKRKMKTTLNLRDPEKSSDVLGKERTEGFVPSQYQLCTKSTKNLPQFYSLTSLHLPILSQMLSPPGRLPGFPCPPLNLFPTPQRGWKRHR